MRKTSRLYACTELSGIYLSINTNKFLPSLPCLHASCFQTTILPKVPANGALRFINALQHDFAIIVAGESFSFFRP